VACTHVIDRAQHRRVAQGGARSTAPYATSPAARAEFDDTARARARARRRRVAPDPSLDSAMAALAPNRDTIRPGFTALARAVRPFVIQRGAKTRARSPRRRRR